MTDLVRDIDNNAFNYDSGYRVRQCGYMFLLEQLGHSGFEPCWLILEQGHSWDWAEKQSAKHHNCPII